MYKSSQRWYQWDKHKISVSILKIITHSHTTTLLYFNLILFHNINLQKCRPFLASFQFCHIFNYLITLKIILNVLIFHCLRMFCIFPIIFHQFFFHNFKTPFSLNIKINFQFPISIWKTLIFLFYINSIQKFIDWNSRYTNVLWIMF